MAAEASVPTKDSQRATPLEPAEDMLADGPDGDRSSGEMLMECVVKVGQLLTQAVSCTVSYTFCWKLKHQDWLHLSASVLFLASTESSLVDFADLLRAL